MALQMPFTDAYGNTHPASFWRVVFVAVDLSIPQAVATLLGFKDRGAHDAGREPVGRRSYTVEGAEFGTLMAQYQSPSGNTDLFALAYGVAQSRQDVNVGGVMKGFFDGATGVEL